MCEEKEDTDARYAESIREDIDNMKILIEENIVIKHNVYYIKQSKICRVNKDVYLVTIEKSADVTFPLGGAVIFYIKGKKYTTHVVEYSTHTLSFYFLVQNGIEFTPGEQL